MAAQRVELKANPACAMLVGVGPSMSVTAVKPSRSVSQTFSCPSGIHPRHAPYYIRRVRISATDSLFKLMRDQGVPFYPEVGQSMEEANTYVLEFPVKAPDHGKTARFKDVLSEYAKAPAVTRERLYLDTMQHVLSATSKIILDYKGSGNLLYLPLDKLMQRNGSAIPSESEASQSRSAPAPTDTTSPRSRDSLRSRERQERP